jgi:DHA3 family tetracycline resistance protein-like MFS transporter
MLEGSIQQFEAVLLAQVLWGIGYTFTSGATEAWITDEIGEDKVGRAFIRSSQIGSIIGLVGTAISVTLGSIALNLPVFLGGVLFIVLAAVLGRFMPETGFKPIPSEERESWKQMADTLRSGVRLVRTRPVLLTILGIGLFYGLFSEGVDRLWTAHFLENFTFPEFGNLKPIVWIGVIQIAGGLLSSAVLQIVIKRVDMTGHRSLARASFGFTSLLVASLLVFAFARNFMVAFLARLVISILRNMIEPLQTTWINQHVDSSVRATVISMSGQVDALGQIAGGPVAGWIGNSSIRAALATSGLILSPVLLLYSRALRRRELPDVVPLAEGTIQSS